MTFCRVPIKKRATRPFSPAAIQRLLLNRPKWQQPAAASLDFGRLLGAGELNFHGMAGTSGILFLDPAVSYRMAQEIAGTEHIPVSEQTLRQRLRQRGLLASTDAGRGMVSDRS